MKLDSVTTPVEIKGGTENSSFSIALNGKAFKVLSDTLYSNKLGSIVRELSCNAYDAHVMAGKKTEPFTIHLPDSFEPWFSVQDLGVGLSDSDVKNVFTVYFQSTKDQSNDAIGAFGLGAKTPFSYTDQFTVTSVKDGVLTIYSAYITESGIPNIQTMHQEPTSQSNGVEIKMSVKREDYYKFKTEVEQQLRFFTVKPLITNGTVTFETNRIAVIENSNVRLTEKFYGDSSTPYIVQGNVGYPLDASQLKDKISLEALNTLKTITFANCVIFFNIGEIGVTASREGVEYNKQTVKNIEDKLLVIDKQVNDYVQAQLNSKQTPWEIAEFLNKNKLIGNLAGNSPIKQSAGVSPNIQFSLRALTEEKQIMPSYSKSLGSTFKYTRFQNKKQKHYSAIVACAAEEVMVVLRDKSTLAAIRIKHLFNTKPKLAQVIELVLDDKVYTDAVVQKVKAALGGMPNVIRMSEIVLPASTYVAKARASNAIPKYYLFDEQGTDSARNWDKMYDKLEEITEDTLYVVVDNMQFVDYKDQAAMSKYKHFMELLSDVPNVIAVRESSVDKLKLNKLFQPLQDYIKVETGKFDVNKMELVLNRHHVLERCTENLSVLSKHKAKIKELAPNSELGRMLISLENKTKNIDPKELQFQRLVAKVMDYTPYYTVLNDRKVQKFTKIKEQIFNKYPVLKLVTSYNTDTLPPEHLGLYLDAMHKTLE